MIIKLINRKWHLMDTPEYYTYEPDNYDYIDGFLDDLDDLDDLYDYSDYLDYYDD